MKKTGLLFITILLVCSQFVQAQDNSSLPHIENKNGRFALIVDGAPYLILGAQSNNSSTWPAVLPKVFSAMDKLHVNTLEIPIYWEQFEPEPGKFDYSVIDAVITQAREHDLRLVLLWFGTWKNGSNHYMPQWMKLQPEKYPNMVGKNGQPIDSPSPHTQATLDADITAFSAFMTHLKEYDTKQTVIMVQVENEPGSWETARDYSKTAQKLFERPVPEEAILAMNVKPTSNKSWDDVFGKNADEYFHVWHVASYIGKVAATGKEIYPLPLMVNAAVRDPFNPGEAPAYQVGGPNDNVFELWKAAAPSIDLLCPDIYTTNTDAYLKLLELYNRNDNPLMVPETRWADPFPRFFYAALGNGAIGYSPFGLDEVRVRFDSDGEPLGDDVLFDPTALNFKVFKPMSSEIAQLNFEGKIKTAVQMAPICADAERGVPWDKVNYVTDKTLSFEGWDVDVAFGRFDRLSRAEIQPEQPDGRILVAELEEGKFLITGFNSRVMFNPTGKKSGRPWQYLAAEEGHFEDGVFVVDRIMNGDQSDYGLVFDVPKVLRVSVYTR